MRSIHQTKRNTHRQHFAIAIATLTFTACFTTADQLTPEELGVVQQGLGMADAPIVISQIYGGGQLTPGSTYGHDYVELFNRSTQPVDLAGWSIQYGSKAGAIGIRQALPTQANPPHVIPPGGYFLIRMSLTGQPVYPPAAPDFTLLNNISMSRIAGKVALVMNNTTLACGGVVNGIDVPCTQEKLDSIVDLVGYGPLTGPDAISGSTAWEGSGPASALNEFSAALRLNGCTDTNDNSADFVIGMPALRNSNSPRNPCMYVRSNPLGTTTCVVKNGSVICWGNNGQGQLGQGLAGVAPATSVNMGDAADEVAGLDPIDLGTDGAGANLRALDVSVGKTHVCALLNDMTLKCWGNGPYLGLGGAAHKGDNGGEMGNALSPLSLDGPVTFLGRAGESHTCVGVSLLTGPALKCFGLNGSGQLGKNSIATIGDNTNEVGSSNTEVLVGLASGDTVAQVVGGHLHTCLRTSAGKVKCWGANVLPNASLGRGDLVGPNIGDEANEVPNLLVDVNLDSSSGARYAKAIAAGQYHTCAIRDDNSLVCWGPNLNGQLGRGDTASPIGDTGSDMGTGLTSVVFSAGKYAVAIATGGTHTCALLNDGTVTCWGLGTNGQLGQGDSVTRVVVPTTPVNIGVARTAISIASGFKHVCVVRDDLQVKCWGDNTNGAIGIGQPNASPYAKVGDIPAEMGDAFLTPVVFP